MQRGRSFLCSPKLDAILETYFSPEGASIKSVMAVTARSTTSPASLNRIDVNAGVGKLMRTLTAEEREELGLYYAWRAMGDLATTKATAARQEARNRGKRRRVKTAIAEVERVWSEKNAPG